LLSHRKLASDPRSLGQWGEKRCERFLKRGGLSSLARNYACKSGELDLVMLDTDGTIVFIEVRTRAADTFATPEDSITYAKKTKLLRTARFFLATHNIYDRPCRFDIVTIILGQTGRPKIKHYKNAFIP